MSKKNILIFSIVGFIFVSVLGTLSHFFYEWSGENKLIGLFFPVNESVWEHLKLAIFPTFVFFVLGLVFLKRINFKVYFVWFFVVIITPMILIPLFFYSYTSMLGYSIVVVDILIFFVSVFTAFLLGCIVLNLKEVKKGFFILSIVGIAMILIFYLTFTYFPPKISLFKDSTTNNYGV